MINYHKKLTLDILINAVEINRNNNPISQYSDMVPSPLPFHHDEKNKIFIGKIDS